MTCTNTRLFSQCTLNFVLYHFPCWILLQCEEVLLLIEWVSDWWSQWCSSGKRDPASLWEDERGHGQCVGAQCTSGSQQGPGLRRCTQLPHRHDLWLLSHRSRLCLSGISDTTTIIGVNACQKILFFWNKCSKSTKFNADLPTFLMKGWVVNYYMPCNHLIAAWPVVRFMTIWLEVNILTLLGRFWFSSWLFQLGFSSAVSVLAEIYIRTGFIVCFII